VLDGGLGGSESVVEVVSGRLKWVSLSPLMCALFILRLVEGVKDLLLERFHQC